MTLFILELRDTMQCEAPHEKWPIKITLKIPLNPSTSTPSLLHAMLVAAWCQVTLCSDTSRPQAHIWDRSRPSVRRYTLRQICKKVKKKNHFAALQTKQAKRAWLISKENCIWKWDIFDYIQALWKNELLPQCVSDRVEKELWEM